MNFLFTLSIAAFVTLALSDVCQLQTKSKPQYGYDPSGAGGPGDWGKMKGSWLCDKGTTQSPINFVTDVEAKPLSAGPKFSLTEVAMQLSPGSNNWGLSCNESIPSSCGHTTFKGVKYNLINLHLHSPSEHELDGKRYPLEAHLVHKSAGGKILVVGTMFQYPDENAFGNKLQGKVNKQFGSNPLIQQCMGNVLKGKSNFKLLIPILLNPSAGVCTYAGSFTTPPCTQGVTWVMQLGVQTISKSQVHEYMLSAGTGLYGNARETQPLNGRKISCYLP